MLIRLMQSFSNFELDSDATPSAFRPPTEWKQEDPGLTTRRAKDSIFPKMGLTMYTGVGLTNVLRALLELILFALGWALAESHRSCTVRRIETERSLVLPCNETVIAIVVVCTNSAYSPNTPVFPCCILWLWFEIVNMTDIRIPLTVKRLMPRLVRQREKNVDDQ